MSYLKKCLQEGPGCDCVDICKFKPKPPPIPDQRDAEIARLTEALAAAESNVTRITTERLTVERGWRAAEARVRELGEEVSRLRHEFTVEHDAREVAESELAQLRERVAKVKIAIGHTWTAEGMREAVEEALRDQ